MDVALDVDVEAAVERILAHQQQIGVVDYTGVVHQHVEPAEILDDLAEHGLDLSEIGGVRLVGDRPDAQRLDRLDRLLSLCVVGIVV